MRIDISKIGKIYFLLVSPIKLSVALLMDKGQRQVAQLGGPLLGQSDGDGLVGDTTEQLAGLGHLGGDCRAGFFVSCGKFFFSMVC